MRRLVFSFVALALLAAPAGAGDLRTLGQSGALLRAAADGALVLTPTQGCRAALSAGEGDCGVLHTAAGPLLFTIEPGPRIDDVLVSRPWSVRVYRPSPSVPDGWDLALSTQPVGSDPGPLLATVTATIRDVTGDGGEELVVGYRSEGTGHFLDVDIVGTAPDGAARVLAHDRLHHGIVVVRPGRMVTHTPVYRARDGNCCPTWIVRSTVRFVDGEFQVDPGRRVRTEDARIPAGDVG